MSGIESLKVGDPVRVYDVNSRRVGQPEGGWPGTVEKVGRKLVTIRWGDLWYQSKQFRMEDGRANDRMGHMWFKTEGQAELDQRRSAAVSVLREHGLTIEYRCSLSLEQFEAIAVLLAAAPPSGGPPDTPREDA